MKKSDRIEQIKRELTRWSPDALAARLAEQEIDLGVKWDPEEEALPDRIHANHVPEKLVVFCGSHYRTLSPHELVEAARRYNLFPEILAICRAYPGGVNLRILDILDPRAV